MKAEQLLQVIEDVIVIERSQARREALEEACKAQCADCEEGSPNFLVGPNYYHREGALTAKCEANLIRALMERED